jgi:predicted transposase/invertase (TIGR01784 family)
LKNRRKKAIIIKKEKIETAKRMLLNDFSVEQVITAAGLTEKEIKELMN